MTATDANLQHLRQSMALCERILGSASLALSVTLDDDPTFRLDLPPVGGPGTAGVIREETLAGMAALWDPGRGGASILASGAEPRLARSAWT